MPRRKRRGKAQGYGALRVYPPPRLLLHRVEARAQRRIQPAVHQIQIPGADRCGTTSRSTRVPAPAHQPDQGWKGRKASILQDGQVKPFALRGITPRTSRRPSLTRRAVQDRRQCAERGPDRQPARRRACVEVPCLIDRMGVNPATSAACRVRLAAMNMTNINVRLMTIEASARKREDILPRRDARFQHTAAELSIDDIVKMCDELIEAHGPVHGDVQITLCSSPDRIASRVPRLPTGPRHASVHAKPKGSCQKQEPQACRKRSPFGGLFSRIERENAV